MGRTFRYNAETGKREGAKKRKLEKVLEPIGIPPEMRKEPVTREAVSAMISGRVESDLRKLVAAGVLKPQDIDHWASYVEDKVCALADRFDPGHIGKNGKPVTASTYFIGAAIKHVMHVSRYLGQKKRKANLITISTASAEEAAKNGMVAEESLSDGCRSVKELEFKMDVATLYSMLTPDERKILDMRRDGMTNGEIGEQFGRDRHWIEKTVLPKIQAVARKCGFFPQSEIRPMERNTEAA